MLLFSDFSFFLPTSNASQISRSKQQFRGQTLERNKPGFVAAVVAVAAAVVAAVVVVVQRRCRWSSRQKYLLLFCFFGHFLRERSFYPENEFASKKMDCCFFSLSNPPAPDGENRTHVLNLLWQG